MTDAAGRVVAAFDVDEVSYGMNRALWDLRLTARDGVGDPGSDGPLVVPGRYTVQLTIGGASWTRPVEVREDPRLDHPAGVRRAWTETLTRIWTASGQARALRDEVRAQVRRIEEQAAVLTLETGVETELRDYERETQELSSRLGRLYGAASDWVGPLTADQASQLTFLTDMLGTLRSEWTAFEARLPG